MINKLQFRLFLETWVGSQIIYIRHHCNMFRLWNRTVDWRIVLSYGIDNTYNWLNPATFVLKCLYQARKVTGRVCVLGVSILSLSRILYWILELFRESDSFCFFHFIIVQWTEIGTMEYDGFINVLNVKHAHRLKI